MTQQTRSALANVLLGVGILAIVVFVVTHFMTTARPSWRTDMVWIGIASLMLSNAVRGRRQRAMQNPD